MCYNRFRYYHPETGRYISEDPIRTKQGKKFIRTDIERLPKEYKGFRKNGFDIAKSTDTSTTLVNKDTGEIITVRKSDSGGV